MEITADPAATTPATAARSPGSAGETGQSPGDPAAITSDFQTFLRLLTAQMKNQDPLDPMKPDDFAVQLATFSGVEQQVRTNDLLAALSQKMGLAGLSDLAGWVGMEARVVAPLRFDGAPLELMLPPTPEGGRHRLTVRDSAGSVVARQDVSGAGGALSWTGTGADGQALPPGTYSFTVESTTEGASSDSVAVAGYGRVVEARAGPDGPLLLLDSGAEVEAGAVTALRRP